MEYKLSPGEETKIATKEILCQKKRPRKFLLQYFQCTRSSNYIYQFCMFKIQTLNICAIQRIS